MSNYQKMVNDSSSAIASLTDLEPQINQAVELTAACLNTGHKLLIAGNGGSAADSAHLTTEFVVRYKDERKPLPAIDLSASSSTLTAMINDYPPDQIFARQIQALATSPTNNTPGDLVILFSTSGQSPNILAAIDTANSLNLKTIAFLGRDGGPAKSKSTLPIIVNHQLTARIQECHQLLLHALCELTEKKLGLT